MKRAKFAYRIVPDVGVEPSIDRLLRRRTPPCSGWVQHLPGDRVPLRGRRHRGPRRRAARPARGVTAGRRRRLRLRHPGRRTIRLRPGRRDHTSVKGATIDAWYSGKHHDFGANIQAIIRRDGLPVWTSPALPGHLHDLTCAQQQGATAALNRAAAELHLPALTDTDYEGAGHGIKKPAKQSADGKPLANPR